MSNFQFSRRAKWPWRDKLLGAPQRGQKIIVNQSKPILVIVSIKPFTRQSFRRNYFSREIEWAVFYWDGLLIIYIEMKFNSIESLPTMFTSTVFESLPSSFSASRV